MNRKLLTTSLTLLLLLLHSHFATAKEVWANDGKRNMVIENITNVPASLSEEQILWHVDSGTKHQYPKPEIVGDKVLIMSEGKGGEDPYWSRAVQTGGELVCRDLKSGEQIWRLIVPGTGYGPPTYGVCGSPLVFGDRLYIVALYDVFCIDMKGLADGNQGLQNELELMMRSGFKVPKGESKPTNLPDWAADVIWHYNMKELGIKVQDATSSTPVAVDGQLWVSTGHELGYLARGYAIKKQVDGKTIETGEHETPSKDTPHMIVLDMETGKLIAKDDNSVPIIFHGEWSSPALLEVNGEKAVIFGDGYGMLRGYELPTPSANGETVMLNQMWEFDLNLPENRVIDGRMHPYTLDDSLKYKYPLGWPDDEEVWHPIDRSQLGAYHQVRGGSIPGGPSEIIAVPVVINNLVYIGLGGDGFYDYGEIPEDRDVENRRGRKFGPGRFMCLEFSSVAKPPTVKWDDQNVARMQSSASYYKGLVYAADNAGFLNCWDADTGEVIYRYDLGEAVLERSQMIADDKVFISDNKGYLHIISTGKEPEELDAYRLKHHAATVEATDGMIVIATGRHVTAYINKEENSE